MDPLENPRPVWKMHYDHRTLAGRWGKFLAKALGLRTTGERHLDELQRRVSDRK
jgi:hypothetical protein